MIYAKALKKCASPLFPIISEPKDVAPEVHTVKSISIGQTTSNKINIIGSKAPNFSEGTVHLAGDMVRKNKVLKDFLKVLRKAAHNEDKSFQFSCLSKSADQTKEIVDILVFFRNTQTSNLCIVMMSFPSLSRPHSTVSEKKPTLNGISFLFNTIVLLWELDENAALLWFEWGCRRRFCL